jgi:hypothetical protein
MIANSSCRTAEPIEEGGIFCAAIANSNND